jgi:ABC-type metal ion transport system substrate-binding protein
MITSAETQNTPGMNTFSHNAFLKNKKRRDGEVCLNSVQNTFLAGGQAKRCADLS